MGRAIDHGTLHIALKGRLATVAMLAQDIADRRLLSELVARAVGKVLGMRGWIQLEPRPQLSLSFIVLEWRELLARLVLGRDLGHRRQIVLEDARHLLLEVLRIHGLQLMLLLLVGAQHHLLPRYLAVLPERLASAILLIVRNGLANLAKRLAFCLALSVLLVGALRTHQSIQIQIKFNVVRH